VSTKPKTPEAAATVHPRTGMHRFWWLSRRDSIIFWCLAALVLALLVLILPNLNERRFEGRTARQWLVDADITRSGTDPAILKIKSFGPQIYPELWRIGTDTDSKMERKLRAYWSKFTKSDELSLRTKALFILRQESGSKLKPLTPSFISTLEKNDASGSDALRFLCAANDDPSVYMPHLVASLEKPSLNMWGLILLKTHQTDAPLALSSLRLLQKSSEPLTRVYASAAIVLVSTGSTNETQLIMQGLSHADSGTRRSSALATSMGLMELIRIDPHMTAAIMQVTQKHPELAPFFAHLSAISSALTNIPARPPSSSNP